MCGILATRGLDSPFHNRRRPSLRRRFRLLARNIQLSGTSDTEAFLLALSCGPNRISASLNKSANYTPDFLDRPTTGMSDLDNSTCAVWHRPRLTCLGCL